MNSHIICIFNATCIVLIDTWWNVNIHENEDLLLGFTVLIDTWWNVNAITQGIYYIVDAVLIDTWWNVNQ